MFPYLIAGAIGYVVAKLFEEDEVPKYADGGLIAPNGKPSNLTPEQYKLVRSKAFKEWFGDWENDPENASKVIDENGEPKPQYHFTDNKFTKFKFKESGFHFGDKSIRDDLSIAKGQNLSIEITAFLNIKNPLRIDDMSRFTPDKLTEKLLYNGIISDEKADELQEIYYELDSDEDSVTKQSNKLIKEINDLGYDGFIYENKFDSQDSKISYLIDDSSSKIYVRNDTGVFKGKVVLLSDSKRKPFLVFTDLNGNEYEVDGNEGEELTSVDKIRIKNMLNSGYYISVVNSPKTYKDYDLFLSNKLFLDSWIAFYPNQIKLADGSNTTFDGNNPDIRYDGGGEIKDLVVLHNINDYQIEEANKIGGLITPSIAILKAGQSFTDFGSITLIGTKELIDPENRSVKVFAGDVYSPSVPRKLYYVDKRLLEKVTNELIKKAYRYDDTISKSDREIYSLVQRYVGNSSDFDRDIEKNSFNKLIEQYFEKLKLIYIVDKSIKIKVPFKDKRHFLWNNAEFTLTPEQKKRFAPILREYTNESNEKGSNGTSKKIRSKVYDLFLEILNDIKLELKEEYKSQKDGDFIYKVMNDGLDESFEKNVGTRYDWIAYTKNNLSSAVFSEKELDKEKLNQNIKKVFTKQVIEDYKKWLSDFINQFRGSAYFLKGNEKMPYTLDNLVDATSNRVIGQEKNITFGVNQAKSFGTKRLKSIDEIKKNSNKLISKEEMNLIDKKNSDNFFNLSESLKYSSSNDWGKLDSLSRAIADYYKGTSIVSALRKNDFSSPSSYQITLFEDFAYELKNSPVDYFEAKYQRAVSLKEFKYAVIPFNTDTKTIDILRSNKLIVKKYKTDDDRFKIINHISEKDKSIKFSNGGLIAPNGKPRKDRFGTTIFEDIWLLTRNEYANESINVYSGDNLKRKKTTLQDYMQTNITNVQHKNRVQKAIDENKFKYALENGFITKERANDIIKSAELNNTFSNGGLIAPNGKPSNLTSEQYKLVRTNEFKAWFGDWENDPANASKVVDENGEPLVVWRGVKASNYDYQKKGYNYFAKNKNYAKIFGYILNQFFLNIRNPLDLEFFNKISAENGLTSFNNEGLFQIGDTQLKNEFETETSLLYLKDLNDVSKKFYYQFDNGDGIIGYDIGVYGKEIVFVTKQPNQIKLADGTNTKFDGENPDIRFDKGGEITLLKNKIKAPFLNKLYGQDVEPSGYYAIEKKTNMFDSDDNYETKKIKYKNPLYIDVDTDTLISWKYKLSNKYKAKGKQLTEKLIKEGYDVIITKYPNGDKGEIIVLDTLKLNNPDIRYADGGSPKKVKFDIEQDEDGDRTEISIKGIGQVILVVTYPEYEFLEDIGEDGLEELGIEEGDMIGKIEHIRIEDKYKGQGYAKLLMNKAIEVAKEKGLMPLYLNASPMGSDGLNVNDLTGFYESFGFEVFLEQGNNNLMILK